MTIKTNDLISILVNAEPAKKPLSFAPVLVGLGIVSCTLTFIIANNLRPEFSTFDFPLSFYIKTFVLLAFALTGSWCLKQSAKPDRMVKDNYIFLTMPAVLTILCIVEWLNAEALSDITSLFLLPNFKNCLFYVTSYGLLGMTALTILMKEYAPTNQKLASAIIGFSSASVAALGYSFNCPIDSPTFIAFAYGIPVFGLSLVARSIVPKFINW